jgi:hypothetical protein
MSEEIYRFFSVVHSNIFVWVRVSIVPDLLNHQEIKYIEYIEKNPEVFLTVSLNNCLCFCLLLQPMNGKTTDPCHVNPVTNKSYGTQTRIGTHRGICKG